MYYTIICRNTFISNYLHICSLICVYLLVLRHVSANNNSHPQGDLGHKRAYDAQTYRRQLYLVKGIL
jgi:hypothetical protein